MESPVSPESAIVVPSLAASIIRLGGAHFLEFGDLFDSADDGFAPSPIPLDIDNFTEPAESGGKKVSQGTLRVKNTITKEWVKNPELVEFYGLRTPSEKDVQAISFVLTSDGWSVLK